MKAILNLCSAASFACVVSFATGSFESSVARKSAEVTALGSHARSKVVQYFDTYRTDPLGLPPDCAARMRGVEIPAAWELPGIASGKVVGESDRSALVEAPAELVRVMPARQPAVRYFLAGNHLVAVDAGYKVMDSIRIPTVRLTQGESAVDAEPVQLVRHVDRRLR